MATRNPGRKAISGRRASGGPAAMRRAPQQDRGQRRYEELLDAAEQVIAGVGVAAMTTNAVAERAGAGMGSLYHFFANKDAIVEALALRYTGVIRSLTGYAMRPELKDMPLADMADAIVDPLGEFFLRAPAYRHVFHAVALPGSTGHCVGDLRESVVRDVESMVAVRAPHSRPQQRRGFATVAVQMVHSMLDAAFELPAPRRRAMIVETKRLLALYAEMLERGDDPLARLR